VAGQQGGPHQVDGHMSLSACTSADTHHCLRLVKGDFSFVLSMAETLALSPVLPIDQYQYQPPNIDRYADAQKDTSGCTVD
jgi:hypothetical protein